LQSLSKMTGLRSHMSLDGCKFLSSTIFEPWAKHFPLLTLFHLFDHSIYRLVRYFIFVRCLALVAFPINISPFSHPILFAQSHWREEYVLISNICMSGLSLPCGRYLSHYWRNVASRRTEKHSLIIDLLRGSRRDAILLETEKERAQEKLLLMEHFESREFAVVVLS
jgi:hypothetical protein